MLSSDAHASAMGPLLAALQRRKHTVIGPGYIAPLDRAAFDYDAVVVLLQADMKPYIWWTVGAAVAWGVPVVFFDDSYLDDFVPPLDDSVSLQHTVTGVCAMLEFFASQAWVAAQLRQP